MTRPQPLALTVHCPTCTAAPGMKCIGPYHVPVRPHRLREVASRPSIKVEGNGGGSYVQIEVVDEGVVELTVGETLVRTIKRKRISVVALACILTHASDKGFQKVLDEYLSTPSGSAGGICDLDQDPVVQKRKRP